MPVVYEVLKLLFITEQSAPGLIYFDFRLSRIYTFFLGCCVLLRLNLLEVEINHVRLYVGGDSFLILPERVLNPGGGEILECLSCEELLPLLKLPKDHAKHQISVSELD